MNTIKTRVTAVALGLTVSALLAGPAAARPAASLYTPQALEAMSANWAAKGRLLGDRPAASFYTRQQLEAMSSNWAAKGRLLGDRPAASFYTAQQLDAMSSSWAARGALLGGRRSIRQVLAQDVQAHQRYTPRAVQPPTIGSTTFDWADFGIGAGAMLGVVLLTGGLVAGVHFSRKKSVRTRTV